MRRMTIIVCLAAAYTAYTLISVPILVLWWWTVLLRVIVECCYVECGYHVGELVSVFLGPEIHLSMFKFPGGSIGSVLCVLFPCGFGFEHPTCAACIVWSFVMWSLAGFPTW